jgi:hypothetical protein
MNIVRVNRALCKDSKCEMCVAKSDVLKEMPDLVFLELAFNSKRF